MGGRRRRGSGERSRRLLLVLRPSLCSSLNSIRLSRAKNLKSAHLPPLDQRIHPPLPHAQRRNAPSIHRPLSDQRLSPPPSLLPPQSTTSSFPPSPYLDDGFRQPHHLGCPSFQQPHHFHSAPAVPAVPSSTAAAGSSRSPSPRRPGKEVRRRERETHESTRERSLVSLPQRIGTLETAWRRRRRRRRRRRLRC